MIADDESWNLACSVAGLRAERMNEVDEMIRIYRENDRWARFLWPPNSEQRHAMSAVVLMRLHRG